MLRLVELFLIALIVYIMLRRLLAPVQRGYRARDRERKEERQRARGWSARRPEQIDRSGVKDAEFKDI